MADAVTRRGRALEGRKPAGAKQSSEFKTIKGARLKPGETVWSGRTSGTKNV